MLRVQLLSDIHFEHHRDSGRSFVNSLDPKGVDVLVLAGDIGCHSGGSLYSGLGLLAKKYGEIPIVTVNGNHEFYGSSRQEVFKHMEIIKRDYPTVHWLENDTVTIKGQRFVGCTLWFPDSPSNREHQAFLHDFRVIKGFENWNYAECYESMEFLSRTVQEGDIVVTHHIPDSQGIHPRFRKGLSAQYNRFFLCQMPQSVLERPAYWFFGHTHNSMRFKIGNCEFRCNPLAYPNEGNSEFIENLIVEVP